MTDQKTPHSEMIRVPTALIPAVKKLSKLHRPGHTIALQQGLEELLTQFDCGKGKAHPQRIRKLVT